MTFHIRLTEIRSHELLSQHIKILHVINDTSQNDEWISSIKLLTMIFFLQHTSIDFLHSLSHTPSPALVVILLWFLLCCSTISMYNLPVTSNSCRPHRYVRFDSNFIIPTYFNSNGICRQILFLYFHRQSNIIGTWKHVSRSRFCCENK